MIVIFTVHMNYKARTVSTFSPVRVYMRMIQPPTIDTGCTTDRFALESLNRPLHVPPATPDFAISSSATAYTGVPTKVIFTVFNGKTTPITNVQITTKVMRDKTTKLASYVSPVFRLIGPNEKVTDVKSITINVPGTVTLKSEATFRADTTKSSCTAKQGFRFDPPIKLFVNFHGTQRPVCQFSVENQMVQPIRDVRVEVGDYESCIAPILGKGDVASGYLNVTKRITAVNAYWKVPGAEGQCTMSIPCDKAPENLELPAKVTLAHIPKMISCYTPFRATLLVKNMWRTQIEGEIAIEEGIISLFGLNRLAFPRMNPSEEKEVNGTFIALREGKVAFPRVKVAIKDGQQFTINVDSGVLVVGEE